MTIRLSRSIEICYPRLRTDLGTIVSHCRRADSDIRTNGLLIEAWRHPSGEEYCGRAYADAVSWFRGIPRSHCNGRITMALAGVDLYDIISVFSHELRHIAQFHRGKQRMGYLTTEHMTNEECEADAYAFETRILSRMGLE